MNKPLKYKPGVFVEIEDFNGGRKVVMTCRDQVTFVDSSSPDESTPIIYHPVMKPEELGDVVLKLIKDPAALDRLRAALAGMGMKNAAEMIAAGVIRLAHR